MATAVLVISVAGCRTIGYYAQAIEGQLDIFQKQKPISKLIASPATEKRLRERLELILELREFAASHLHLPVDEHYLRYADIGREYVVWNVHAAPEFSLEPKTWWYPFVGRAKYRGFFKEAEADRYARRLAEGGYDVHVEGAPAYSTLGWFKDPVLNTFVYDRESTLAETLFHELAHQRVFVAGDTDFNEAFATSVGEEGVRRWYDAKGDAEAMQRYLAGRQRREQFLRLVKKYRGMLESLYETGDSRVEPGSPAARGLREQKHVVMQAMREEYAALKAEWGGWGGYDEWFAGPLNNAQLNTISTYYELVPAFRALLARQGGDLEQFYVAVERLGKLDKDERHAALNEFLGRPSAAQLSH